MFDFEKGRLRYIKGGRYPHCHSLFIDDQIRAFIDPACDDTILKSLHSEKEINIIINSHCHEDHFLNNYLFPDAELWAHELEAPMFRDMEVLLDAWMSPEERAGEKGDEARDFLINVAHYTPREPDRLLRDGEEVSFGDTRLQVLHMPGHSPGHLCFLFPDERVLFAGDLDLVRAGPYYGDRGSDIDDTIQSLKRMMALDVDTYLVAHGKQGIYEGNPEFVQNYLDVIYQRENRLLEALRETERTLDDIAALGIIYGKRDESDIWFIAASERNMMRKHLNRLLKQGRIVKSGNTYTAV